ncbi:hypothetical protein WA026_019258 [Henosepilachna vigintioctopunctata]|uniref:PDZ domain-containing protein n=1 Tax=Henosepilachna vigintioctopunctata TaxID=420089 RepID=A0AAW1U934_9CUCU
MSLCAQAIKGYGDLVASVQRLQLQLEKAGTGGGLSGIEGRVVAVQSLLLSPQFGKALAVHNKVQTVRSKTIPRPQSLPKDTSTSSHFEETSLRTTIPDHRYSEDNIKIIKIEKSTEPLVATVRNEGDAVVIGRVVIGGAAHQSGLLHEGDEILEVNGVEMRGKSVNTVCDILQTMDGELTFLIVPASQAKSYSGRDSVLHVRAPF